MRLAVVGTGLIGASAALAARRSGTEVVGGTRIRRRSSTSPASAERSSRRRRSQLARGRRRRARRGAGCGAGRRSCRRARPRADGAAPSRMPARRRVRSAPPRATTRGSSAAIRSAAPRRARPGSGERDLFEGATWFLAPLATISTPSATGHARVRGGSGARPVAIDPSAHDRLVAVTSHLPHALANVLLNQAARRGSTGTSLGGRRRLASRHDAHRGREPAHLGRHLPREPRGAATSLAEHRRRVEQLEERWRAATRASSHAGSGRRAAPAPPARDRVRGSGRAPSHARAPARSARRARGRLPGARRRADQRRGLRDGASSPDRGGTLTILVAGRATRRSRRAPRGAGLRRRRRAGSGRVALEL